ncbi:hypothetical protein BH23BAC1_BH23BAC1_11620 [soil metagenome]
MTSFIKVASKWRWIVGIIFFILIVFLSLQLLINFNINPVLENYTKKAIKDATHNLYEVEFKEFHLNLATATLHIKDLELRPDTVRYQELLAKDSADANLYWLTIPLVKISRIGFMNAIFEKKLNVGEVKVKQPSLKVAHFPQVSDNDTTEVFDVKDLISGHFNSFRIKRIKLDDLSISYNVVEKDAPQPILVNNIYLNLDNLYLDSANLNQSKFTDDINFSVHDFSYHLPDSLYIIKIKEVGISQSESIIYLDSVELIPRFTSHEFFKKVGTQTDRITFKNKRIQLNQVNFKTLLGQQKLIAGSLQFEDNMVDVFRNKNYPENLIRRPKTLQKFLKELDFYLKIDTVKILKTNVRYRENIGGSDQQAYIDFNNIYASIYNLTNDPVINKEQRLMIDAQATLLNSTLLKAHFNFDLSHPRDKYYLKGTVNPLNLTRFNDLLLPMASVKIEDGKLLNATFSATADDHEGTGTMEFKYDNLKIKILDPTGESGFKEKITSFVANTFVVKKSNPNGGGLRLGEINFQRDKSKSMFHFWGRMMLTGVASSVGISGDKVKTEVKNNEKEGKSNKRSI